MYCGSCMRDNNLAAELIAQGHDVILLPLYTPTRTDEPNVSQPRVFFGGISIYLEQKLGLFRWTPKFLDRLWDRPSVINAFAGRGVEVAPAQLGAMTVSMLEGRDGRQRKEVDNLVRWLRSEPAPDVVTLPYTLLIALAKPIKQAIGRPVICTLQGEELFLEGLPEPYKSRSLDLIRRQINEVDAFIAVSHYEGRFMANYFGIPPSKIHTVPLGISLQGHGPATAKPDVFTIGYLARIAPEKGLHLFAEAYIEFRKRSPPARLQAAGYLAPENRKYLASVEERLRQAGMIEEFKYWGEVDRDAKIRFLQQLHVFSLPATYDEPKGIPVIEAMANGIPVVQPRRGAFPELVEATGGGLLVDPDSPVALADAWRSLRDDPALASELGSKGAAAVPAQFSLVTMARRALEVYGRQSAVLAGIAAGHN